MPLHAQLADFSPRMIKAAGGEAAVLARIAAGLAPQPRKYSGGRPQGYGKGCLGKPSGAALAMAATQKEFTSRALGTGEAVRARCGDLVRRGLAIRTQRGHAGRPTIFRGTPAAAALWQTLNA